MSTAEKTHRTETGSHALTRRLGGCAGEGGVAACPGVLLGGLVLALARMREAVHRLPQLEAQLTAARNALAACREVREARAVEAT